MCVALPTITVHSRATIDKPLWLEANKHFTPAYWQVLEQNRVIKAVKGINPPLTCVACRMVECTFHRDHIGTGVCRLNAKHANMWEFEQQRKGGVHHCIPCPDRSRKEPHDVGDHTTISRGMGGNSQRALIVPTAR